MFRKVFKNWFFIYFSFVNLFLPFYTTIISSLLPPHATLNITATGLTTSFIGIFNQLLFLICISLFFVFNNNVKHFGSKNIDKKTISLIMLIYSTAASLLFIGTSLLYIKFSVLYIGYQVAFDYALQFILIISPTFIINAYIYSIIAAKLESKQWMSILLYTILFVLNLCLIPLFYLTIQWESNFQLIGIGLGMLVSSLLTLLIAFLLNYKTINFRNEFKPTFVKNTFKFFFLKTSNFVFNFILSTVMKCFLLMILGLALKSYDKSTFTSLMMSKIIWYHSLYFCGFIADGLLYTIEYCLNHNLFRQSKIC